MLCIIQAVSFLSSLKLDWRKKNQSWNSMLKELYNFSERPHIFKSIQIDHITVFDASLSEGHAGVFSWCVISWFYFPWNVKYLGNYFSRLLTRRFCVTREKPEFLTDIRDFTTLFHVILRCKSSKWLEWYIESDLGMWFAIWSLDLHVISHSRFCFLQILFLG